MGIAKYDLQECAQMNLSIKFVLSCNSLETKVNFKIFSATSFYSRYRSQKLPISLVLNNSINLITIMVKSLQLIKGIFAGRILLANPVKLNCGCHN